MRGAGGVDHLVDEGLATAPCALHRCQALGIQVRLMAADLGRACVDVVFLYFGKNEGPVMAV